MFPSLVSLLAAERQPQVSKGQLRWYLFARALIIGLFLVGAVIFQLRSDQNAVSPVLSFLYLLGGLSCLQVMVSAALLPRFHSLRFLVQVQIVWDLLLSSSLIYITGGIESIFSFLYIFVIISSSLFLGRRDILFVASASSILYGSLLDLQYYGYLPYVGGLSFVQKIDGASVFYAVLVNVLAFFCTAFLSAILVSRLRRSEEALEKRKFDIEELENLNQTILANVTSGLMIINPEGKIRSFNQAASKITGLSLANVYGRDIRKVFHDFDVIDESGFVLVSRAEGTYLCTEGKTLTLGYASSLVKDPQEQTLGLLVTFQDLTELKLMEDQLKRADRLAAVGRLASGMAHEIRNPLASISGSAQLLIEGKNLSEDEQRLMKIIVKEADRLNVLLTDFLVYARPRPSQLEGVDIAVLLDELSEMISGDNRFSTLSILRHYPAQFILHVDRQQFRQALWNLAINAVEVMPDGGTLTLGGEVETSSVYVEDTGPGIPGKVRSRIFEPFFTTKDKGSGLGLATVYAIVEGHGGTIRVTDGVHGGTRFTIALKR
ncbi:ATP-binding protein [Trichloromonas sp.]|uniref:two-component system sensor histidine kinase NtrB n=1 Tax=Trichloromonas sp. TaxID=3069249 RepID=UPI003D8154A0